MKTKTQKKLKK